jgi:hypothetical protein
MPLLYPAAPATLSGDTESISRFLKSPALVARRLRTLAEQRFIADALLTGRLPVDGGSVEYETGESIYSGTNPGPVMPGSEYPLVTVGDGNASIASVVKWGQDTLVTDEAIKRRRMSPVEKALQKLVNQTVKYVDSVALSAIASAVTNTQAATAAFSGATATQIFGDVADLVADIRALNEGYEPDTVVTDDVTWAQAMSKFVGAGLLPRESASTPLLTGSFPEIAGLRWLSTPNIPTAGVLIVLDSKQLGSMADEKDLSPGYYSADGVGIEAKTMRDDDNDRWRLRARRVTVPVVENPAAAKKLTGV